MQQSGNSPALVRYLIPANQLLTFAKLVTKTKFASNLTYIASNWYELKTSVEALDLLLTLNDENGDECRIGPRPKFPPEISEAVGFYQTLTIRHHGIPPTSSRRRLGHEANQYGFQRSPVECGQEE